MAYEFEHVAEAAEPTRLQLQAGFDAAADARSTRSEYLFQTPLVVALFLICRT